MKLGEVLRHYRVFNELALREVSKEIGIGAATLMRLEHGLEPDGITLAKVLRWLMSAGTTNGTRKERGK
jgi:transcriptional regulator with XRE-family HTH domain